MPWAELERAIQTRLQETLDTRWERAYRLVPEMLSAVFGRQNSAWETYRVEGKLHVRAKRAAAEGGRAAQSRGRR